VSSFKQALLLGCALLAPVGARAAEAPALSAKPEADGAVGVSEIVVTAQKREQKINDVPMSITAVTGDDLAQRGVTNVADLTKIVPSFTFAQGTGLTPVYVLRGVGLFIGGVASSPAVSVYVDEAPLPFTVMTKTAGLDVERVEVLKGPQGTLFGQNSTGGAINYIAAKPTSTLQAGGSFTYDRFGKADATGFISGPITDTLKARFAARVIEGGAWQQSLTRPGDTLGDARDLQARIMLDWQAAERVNFVLSLTADRDNSDTIAGQLAAIAPVFPAKVPGLLDEPISPSKPRAADWTPSQVMQYRDRFYQVALRGTWDVTDNVSLISLSSYEHQRAVRNLDNDATAENNVYLSAGALLRTFNQELRLTGHDDRLTWIVGGNYDHTFSDDVQEFTSYASTTQPFPTLPPYHVGRAGTRQTINDYAVFANVEYRVTDALTAQAALRYTDSKRQGTTCSYDPTPGDPTGVQLNALQQFYITTGQKTTPYKPIAPNDCWQLSDFPDFSSLGALHPKLHEDNLGWRTGLTYKTGAGALLYANYSRGFKDGVISPGSGILPESFAPVKQERLDAYEVGFKLPLFERLVQVNGAAFFYDYQNKQIQTRIKDPVFGLLQQLDNVPKSQVKGLEGDITAHPMPGLDLRAGATYLDAKVKGTYRTYNAAGILADYDGAPLPYTPKVSAVADAQYQWELANGLKPFVGASLTYHAKSQVTFETAAFPAPAFRLPAYTLLDLRAGVSASDDHWRVELFGRNVTDEFYLTNFAKGIDTSYRYVGMPATYGVTVTFRPR